MPTLLWDHTFHSLNLHEASRVCLCTVSVWRLSSRLSLKVVFKSEQGPTNSIWPSGWQDALLARSLGKTFQWITWTVCGLAILWLWQKPAAQLDPAVMWPIGNWLHLPYTKRYRGTGVITAIPWMTLVRRTSSCLTQGFVRLYSRLSAVWGHVLNSW